MIDHTGHPHPSTPKARALCRANGGTGFIGKIGGDAPVAKKENNDKPIPRKQPHVVDVTPKPTPKAPAAPKKPTVPKDHGDPKPPRSAHKKAAPKAPVDKPPTAKPLGPEPKGPVVALPVPGQRKIPPTEFDKESMEIRGIDGTWKEVGSIESGQSARGGTVVFKDKNGHLIASVPRTDTVDVRNKQGIAGNKVKNGHVMSGFIPAATSKDGTLQQIKIQNALRLGASRDFIKSRSSLSPEETDRQIDLVLSRYGVPNHLYPRKGGGGPAPDIKAVKPTPVAKVTQKVAADGSVKTPVVVTPELRVVKASVDVHPEMKETVNRVLTIQASHVGDKISRVRSVDSKLPAVGTPAGERMNIQAGTLAVCTNDGRIHLHAHMHTKEGLVDRNIESGWFTRGGKGNEQTLAHEMGHALLTDYKMSSNERKQLALSLIEALGLTNPRGNSPNLPYYLGHLDGIVQHKDNKGKIRRRVSKYAATNANELIAEVWSEYTMNPKPRPAIKKIGDTLKGIIERGR